MPTSAKFFAHLPNCPACRAVLAYLQGDSALRLYAYKHRNCFTRVVLGCF